MEIRSGGRGQKLPPEAHISLYDTNVDFILDTVQFAHEKVTQAG